MLSRDEAGEPLPEPPILWDIETDPVLAGTKLIAEAWDAGGLYQVGRSSGDRWVEWNGRFRDDVRSFVKSDPRQGRGARPALLGSPDVYGRLGASRRERSTSSPATTASRSTTSSPTTRSTTRRTAKANRDGSDQNQSWNCGVEGPDRRPGDRRLRRRQIKNLLTLDARWRSAFR